MTRWPPTRYQQHLRLEQERRAAESHAHDAYLATLTESEREVLRTVAMDAAAERAKHYIPKRQRSHAINRYGRHDERVAAWQPRPRKK